MLPGTRARDPWGGGGNANTMASANRPLGLLCPDSSITSSLIDKEFPLGLKRKDAGVGEAFAPLCSQTKPHSFSHLIVSSFPARALVRLYYSVIQDIRVLVGGGEKEKKYMYIYMWYLL